MIDRALPDIGYTHQRRRGPKVALDDGELLCLVVAQDLVHGMSSETPWVRYAQTHLKPMFPGMPNQSGYKKGVRAEGPLI